MKCIKNLRKTKETKIVLKDFESLKNFENLKQIMYIVENMRFINDNVRNFKKF